MLQLQEFDLKTLLGTDMIAVIGPSQNNFQLISDILYNHHQIKYGTVMTTNRMKVDWTEIMPSDWVHNECTMGLLNDIVSRQKKMIQARKSCLDPSVITDIDVEAFLVLDDCQQVYDKIWNNDNLLSSCVH